MIILIDNKNFMIRYCKDEPRIHGFDTSFPCWQGWMRLLSDIGETVVVSGPEAEEYLDSHNIYYVHVEHVAKESFFKFERRLNRLVEENKEYIETSMSFGKLVFAVTKDGSRGTINTDNLLEIWRYNEDGMYYVDVNIDVNMLEHKRVAEALVVEKAIAKLLHAEDLESLEELSDIVDDVIYHLDADAYETLFTAETLHEAAINALAICELIAE